MIFFVNAKYDNAFGLSAREVNVCKDILVLFLLNR
jgi:hypothetical protein